MDMQDMKFLGGVDGAFVDLGGTDVDLATRDGILAFMKKEHGRVRDFMRRNGGIPQSATLFVSRDPDTNEPLARVGALMLRLDALMVGGGAKDVAVALMRSLAEKHLAVGILTVFETWTSKLSPEERARWTGSMSIADLPPDKRGESIWSTLDHIAIGKPKMWEAKIERSATGAALPGEFVEVEVMHTEGRFTGLLPRGQWQ